MTPILRSKIHSSRGGFNLQPITLPDFFCQIKSCLPTQVVTFIGGGGKTGLMFLWARSLRETGLSVVTCTTTRFRPQAPPGVSFFHPESLQEARIALQKVPKTQEILTLTGTLLPKEGKLSGIPPAWIDQLSLEFPDTVFFVEGDGSAGRSLKGHLPHEPVIPACTSVLVPVIGLEVIGHLLNEVNVHRPGVFSEITGIRPGAPIGPSAISAILFNPGGYLHKAPKTALVVPFFNKIETLRLWKSGIRIAQQTLSARHPQIASVLIGSVHRNCFVRFS